MSKKDNKKKDIKVCMAMIIDGNEENCKELIKILNKVNPDFKEKGYEIIVSNQIIEWKNVDWLIDELKRLKEGA